MRILVDLILLILLTGCASIDYAHMRCGEDAITSAAVGELSNGWETYIASSGYHAQAFRVEEGNKYWLHVVSKNEVKTTTMDRFTPTKIYRWRDYAIYRWKLEPYMIIKAWDYVQRQEEVCKK